MSAVTHHCIRPVLARSTQLVVVGLLGGLLDNGRRVSSQPNGAPALTSQPETAPCERTWIPWTATAHCGRYTDDFSGRAATEENCSEHHASELPESRMADARSVLSAHHRGIRWRFPSLGDKRRSWKLQQHRLRHQQLRLHAHPADARLRELPQEQSPSWHSPRGLRKWKPVLGRPLSSGHDADP